MTIFYPYPQHANMEIEEDVERVARWLGTIVKPAYFNAFYHKPSVSTHIPLASRNFPSPLPGTVPGRTRTSAHGMACAPFKRRCVRIAMDVWLIVGTALSVLIDSTNTFSSFLGT